MMTSRTDNYWYWILGRSDFTQDIIRKNLQDNFAYLCGWYFHCYLARINNKWMVSHNCIVWTDIWDGV